MTIMNPISEPYPEFTCREFVELVTEYLEGSLTPAACAYFEAHLAACEGCQIYLDQMQQTIKALGKLCEEAVPVAGKTQLLACFRDWKHTLPVSLPSINK